MLRVDGHIARLVQRPRIVGMAGVAQIDLAEAGKRHAVAAVTGRHHAIEHVDAARDRFQQILGRADAHQVARAIGGSSGAVASIIDSITACGSPTARPPIA